MPDQRGNGNGVDPMLGLGLAMYAAAHVRRQRNEYRRSFGPPPMPPDPPGFGHVILGAALLITAAILWFAVYALWADGWAEVQGVVWTAAGVTAAFVWVCWHFVEVTNEYERRYPNPQQLREQELAAEAFERWRINQARSADLLRWLQTPEGRRWLDARNDGPRQGRT